VLTAAAGGTVPDVMHTSVAWTRGFWLKGALQELSAQIKQTPSLALDGFINVFWREAPLSTIVLPVLVLIGWGVAFFAVARYLARRWEAV